MLDTDDANPTDPVNLPNEESHDLEAADRLKVVEDKQKDNPTFPDGHLVAASYRFMGPIPSPQDLARYEAVIPGLADRLINRFEKQSDHRMTMETSVTASDALRANLGLAAGFIVAVVMIIGSVYLIAHGHDVSGTLLGTGTLGSLVGTFVYGTNIRNQERGERRKALMESDEEIDEKDK